MQKPLRMERLESQIDRQRASYTQKMSVIVTNGERTDFVDSRFEKPINVQKNVSNCYKRWQSKTGTPVKLDRQLDS